MPLLSAESSLGSRLSTQLMKASEWIGGWSGERRDFSPDLAIDRVSLIDERLRPKAPMPKDAIDIRTQLSLSNQGFHNAQQVTAESHPELYQAWHTMCQRAGYGDRVPQLIITESRIPNAGEMNHGAEMMITTGLLRLLTLREVTAVLGHELGHGRHDHAGLRTTATIGFGAAGALVGNYLGKIGGVGAFGLRVPRWEPLARITDAVFGPVQRLVERFYFPTLPQGSHPRPASLLGYAAYIAGGVWLGSVAAKQISVKPTELQADLDGVAISGDPEAAASSLRKLEALDTRGPVQRWWNLLLSGYPSMDERLANIERAGREIPANPIPAAHAPAPAAQVSGVALGSRVASADTAPGL